MFMQRKTLSGVMAPAATPFGANGDVDAAAFMANVRAHLAAGLSGIVVTGSTGEAALLGEEERLVLVDAARAIVPEDRWLIAGIGAESTRLTILRAQKAAQRGGVFAVESRAGATAARWSVPPHPSRSQGEGGTR